MQKSRFRIGDWVNVYAAEVRGLTHGIILNVSTEKQDLYLVSHPFDIQWMGLGAIDNYEPESLVYKNLPACPHPLLINKKELPPGFTQEYLGTWRYVGNALMREDPRLQNWFAQY